MLPKGLLPASRWPRALERPVYETVRTAYLDRLFATGQVRAAYQMGGIRAPGLSDLDLLIVCRDPLQKDLNDAADIRALGEEAQYVLMHSQFLMNEAVFRRQKALFFGSDVRHLRGEKLEVEEPPADVADASALAFNVEMMLQRFATFERIRNRYELPAVRPLLAALHSIRFNLESASRWADVSHLSSYAERMADLRARWFDLDREEALARLEAMLDDAVETIAELVGQLRPAAARLHEGASYCTEGRVEALEIHEVQRFGPRPLSVRLRPNPFGRALPRSLRRTRAIRPHLAPVTEVRVPGEFFVFPAMQAEALRDLDAPGLARRVHGELKGHAAPALREAMEERAAAILDLRRFAARNRLRRLSYLLPACWQRPYPWQFRVKARLLAAAGIG